MAGLWQRWEGEDGQAIESCNILTTDANELVRSIHDRMPVILAAEHHAEWLDTTTTGGENLQAMLAPYPAAAMTAHPVGKQVNRPAHDAPDCIAPVAQAEDLPATPDLFS